MKKTKKAILQKLQDTSAQLDQELAKSGTSFFNPEKMQEAIANIKELSSQLKTANKPHFTMSPFKNPEPWRKDPALMEIYMKMDSTQTEAKCSKCGKPSHGNKVNGKALCAECISSKKQPKINSKITVETIQKPDIKEEQRAFFIRGKQLGGA